MKYLSLHRLNGVWSGGMPLRLFKGEWTYTPTLGSDGTVQFEMQEIYIRTLVPMIVNRIPNLQPAFDEFARVLKARAEH